MVEMPDLIREWKKVGFLCDHVSLRCLGVQVLTENTGREAELDKVAQKLEYALNGGRVIAAVAMCLECIISKCTTSLQDIALSQVPIEKSRCLDPDPTSKSTAI